MGPHRDGERGSALALAVDLDAATVTRAHAGGAGWNAGRGSGTASASTPSPALAVGVQRRLYRVVKGAEEGYELQALTDTTRLSTGELYLDEIEVTPGTTPVRFAALEVPLPPGAMVDSTTWGIGFPNPRHRTTPDGDDEEKLVGLEAARHETTRFGYVVPVDDLSAPTRIRHLVRFAQKGSFVLPRARLYRMYQPSAKAIERGTGLRRMEVQ